MIMCKLIVHIADLYRVTLFLYTTDGIQIKSILIQNRSITDWFSLYHPIFTSLYEGKTEDCITWLYIDWQVWYWWMSTWWQLWAIITLCWFLNTTGVMNVKMLTNYLYTSAIYRTIRLYWRYTTHYPNR